MCIYVCVLPHLAENIDGFVLIEEPHDDTNILLLKSKIEVQQYIQLSYLLPPLLPSSPHPFLPDFSFFCLATSLPPTQTSLPLSSLLFSSSCAPPIPLLYTNSFSPYLNLSQWNLRIICETPGDQFLPLIILTIVGGVVESVVLCTEVFHRLVMRVCKYKLLVQHTRTYYLHV